MSIGLYVDLTTRGRVWLESRAIPLPDPWAPEDIPVLIEQHFPGGRESFLRRCREEVPYEARLQENEQLSLRALRSRERSARKRARRQARERHYRAIRSVRAKTQPRTSTGQFIPNERSTTCTP